MQRKQGYVESLCTFESAHVGAVVQIRGELDLTLLRECLYLLFTRHPMLQCTIHQEKDLYLFNTDANIDNIPLRVSKRTKVGLWKEVLEDEIRESFPSHQFLWKLLALEDPKIGEHDIVGIFHHAIVDGLSVFHFFHELLNCYSMLYQGKKPVLQNLPFMPPVETMMQKTQSQTEIKKIQADQWTYEQPAPLSERKSKNLYLILDENKIQKMKKRCKSNQVTLHSMLSAAMALAFSRLHDQTINICLNTPVNLRPYCKPPIGLEHIGCFFSMIPIEANQISPSSLFWPIAKDYEKKIKGHISALPTDFDLQSIRHIFPTEQSSSPIHLTVSNLGDLGQVADYSPLHMNSFYFTTSQVAGNLAFVLHVNTLENKMFLCLAYPYPLISEKTAKEFLNLLHKTLEEATQFEERKSA